MKTLVNLGLSHISVPETIENARHYVTSITANALTFATPNPPLANISAAANNLELAYNNALAGGKTFTTIMRDKKTLLDNLLIQLSHYVEATANGTDATVLIAGMNLKGKGGRSASVFSVVVGKLPGTLELHAPYKANVAFLWEMVKEPIPDAAAAIDPAHTWIQAGVSHKASFVVSELIVGTKYWFRYSTVGRDGQGAWSDPISKVVAE
jgi:hypothetical protein